MPESRINLFQYWDTGAPPAEVERLIETWRSDDAFIHRFYDERSAEDYIARHAGQRALEAFRLCAFGAMQADLFRYVALLAEGGIWMDADQGNLGGLAQFVQVAPEGMLMAARGSFANGCIFVRRPGSPLLARILQTAIENIERRLSNNVSKVTGPMVFDAAYGDDATRPLFDGWLIEDKVSLRRYIEFVRDLTYKETEMGWQASAYGAPKSIFRDEPFVHRAGDAPAFPAAERPSGKSVTRPSQQEKAAPLGQELAERTAELAAMRKLQQKRDEEVRELRELGARRDLEMRELRERKDARFRALQQRCRKQKARLAELERALKEIQGSTAWRLTSPVRALLVRVRRLRQSP